MKKLRNAALLVALVIFALPIFCGAAEESKKEVLDIGEVKVTAPGKEQNIIVTPSTTMINIEEYETPAVSQNISDIVKDRAIIDIRGETELVPDDDTVYMRGFSSTQFVTAIDGLTVEKTGGRKGSHIVDYALLPLWDTERVEILPGPHSALYPGKSIGGVLNMITKTPAKYPTLKPDVHVMTSYRSYATQNHSLDTVGSVSSFAYGVGFQKYQTDGYLRNNKADIDTVSGKLSYMLPSDGYVSLSASYTDADREVPVKNNPGGDYDSDYPDVSTSSWEPWQKPTWDKEASSYRFKYNQPTSLGTWNVGAYYSEENRDRAYWDYVDSGDPNQGTYYESWVTKWDQWGGKIQDEIELSNNHRATFGSDMVQMYDGTAGEPGSRHKRIETRAGYVQDKWAITPRLDLTAGVRYEDVSIWVSNTSGSGSAYITTQGAWIKRNWGNFVPKSYLTYELDDLSPALRDSSLSLGLSRIWHPPSYHGDYNPQGRPSGAYLEPEHGYAYDLIAMRRLWGDVTLKFDYGFYMIKDFIANNRTYAQYTPSGGNPVTPGLEYSDYKINLEEVHRHGFELELGGHAAEGISFYLSYAYQEFDNQGSEPAGTTELEGRAKHRVNAGVHYDLFKNTLLMVDYKFQDEQISNTAEEIAQDVWVFDEIPLDNYQVVDVAIKHKFFKDRYSMKEASFKFYINNLLDEDYEDESGYPMTDRTYGAALTFVF